MAVTVAAATALASPVSYPTSLMVLGLGGYRFVDYLRMGLPITAMTWVMSMLVIPRVWSF